MKITEFPNYFGENNVFRRFRSIKNVIALLSSSHVEIRMACGEMLAIILERGRMSDETFLEEYVPNLIELTSILSKDSQKHRGKKERKAQRASFRDVLRYLEVCTENQNISNMSLKNHFSYFAGRCFTGYSNPIWERIAFDKYLVE